MAGRSAVEEAMSIRYILRSLGVPIESGTYIYGDNMSMLQSSSIPNGTCKAKHIALSYNILREAVAAGIVIPRKIDTEKNYSDGFTKALTGNTQHNLYLPLWVNSVDH